MKSKPSWPTDRAFDVLIVGGGMVGASLALALRPLGLSVGVVEARKPGELPAPGGFDARATALAWGSRRILEAIGIWPELASSATPIERVHVSEHRRFGATVLDASDCELPALGYVVENACLVRALDAALSESGIILMQPAMVEKVETTESARVATVSGVPYRARLLVVADGARSTTRAMLDIAADEHDYGQCAIVANVATVHHHGNMAWERFTPVGPLAFLPITDGRSAIVWTVPNAEADMVMALDDRTFVNRLDDLLARRLGGVTRVGRRQAWPLARVLATRQVSDRAVLLGNAAHSLHPIAGQGFNLSLRDVGALAEAIADGVRAHGDPASAATLAAWQAARHADQRRVGAFIDGLNTLFTMGSPGLPALRGAGIGLFGLWRPGRRVLARYGAGLGGVMPRLARGLPL